MAIWNYGLTRKGQIHRRNPRRDGAGLRWLRDESGEGVAAWGACVRRLGESTPAPIKVRMARGGNCMAKLAVIYYSATGHTYRVAQAVEEGAREAGAETRLRRVAEPASEALIAANPAWQAHVAEAAGVQVAALDDLEWADGYAFGSPTRYGVMAGALKQFFDGTGALWGKGVMANKPVAAFTGAANPHGGQETTLHTIYNVMYHWGAVIVPPGYTDR